MTSLTTLKRAAVLRAGGTPAVDDPAMWDDVAGTEWVAIADMTRSRLVLGASRRVSALGMADRRLPLGRPGTVLFAMYASLGATATLGIEATWNQAILGIEGRSGVADDRFIAYWLEHLARDLNALARSNTQDNLNAEQVGNLPFPAIGVDDQREIADFLDYETAQIDALTGRKRQLLDLLASRWQASVRARLAQYGPLIPLKRRWRVIDCKHRTPAYLDDGYPVVSPGDLTPYRLELARCVRFVGEEDFQDLTDGRLPQRGDVIYSRNASAGTAVCVDTDEQFCMGQDVCLITSSDQDQRFLTYALNTVAADQLEPIKIGSTITRINVDQIGALTVPAPPVETQRLIADALDAERDRMERLTAAIREQIDLLRERRQSLITAAVTGQLRL